MVIYTAPGTRPIASATIDAQCLVDVTPVAGADGVAELTYELCDVHALLQPLFPATPYGADAREPGDLANRCTQGLLTVTVVAPAEVPPDENNPDPDPTCVVDIASTTAGTAIDIAVLANDSDTDLGGQISPLVVDSAGIEGKESVTEAGGSADPTGDGSAIRYTPGNGFVGTDTFIYAALDTAGQACNAEVTVTVSAGPGGGGPGGGGPGGGGSGGGGSGGELPATGVIVGPSLQLGLSLVLFGTVLMICAGATRRRAAGLVND